MSHYLLDLPLVVKMTRKAKIKGVQSLYCTWDCEILVVVFHKTVVGLFSNEKKNMLTDKLYKCVQSISISEQS